MPMKRTQYNIITLTRRKEGRTNTKPTICGAERRKAHCELGVHNGAQLDEVTSGEIREVSEFTRRKQQNHNSIYRTGDATI